MGLSVYETWKYLRVRDDNVAHPLLHAVLTASEITLSRTAECA